MEAGASSYLLKTSSAAEIAQAIRSTYQGHKVIEPAVTEKIIEHRLDQARPKPHDELTNRELDVLHLIGQGYSNQAIAEELVITLKTVKTHVSNIFTKLEVEDRTQAAIYAVHHHLDGQ